ncbi:MAG: asparagine synthase (glutamine-hydrolyzing) [Myxococcales bacterium]|nr:MAG: asparagine synthase (glutamine-hydrolyzing) [Myxococcales bacterium]
MCGICGIHSLAGPPPAAAEIDAMLRTLRHRGPDGEGRWLDGPSGLGQRRLAVIDLPGGGQPMANEDGTIWITFNGEIYNFRELRNELAARGHVFRTASDTEAILHAYEEYGLDALTKLRGMFAFALVDAARGRVLLARDRFGIKPLFYAMHAGRLLFASEIKAILAVAPDLRAALDKEALALAFALPYIPAPLTAFAGIRKLSPAHALVLENDRIRLHRYWNFAEREPAPMKEAEALERLDAAVSDAVRAHLVADVPLGAFLSGGVDSSLVTAMMVRHAEGRVRTFSIRFEEEAFDESPYARRVASHLGTEHEELTVRADAAGLLETLVDHFDEPFADSSAVPTYLVSRLARERVKVVLTGDGGDELFGGYVDFQKYRVVDAMRRAPDWLLRAAVAATRSAGPATMRTRLRRLAERGLLPFPQRYLRAIGLAEEFRRLVLTPEFRDDARSFAVFDGLPAARGGDISDAMQLHALSVLPDDYLTKVDRMSMAHGLETRVPLLDHHVAEFAAALPVSLKLRGLTTKYLLKKLAARLVPREIVYRPKQGFTAPVERWLRNEWRERLQDLVLSPRALARGYFEPEGVRKAVALHLSGGVNWPQEMWFLLFFETWMRRIVEREGES